VPETPYFPVSQAPTGARATIPGMLMVLAILPAVAHAEDPTAPPSWARASVVRESAAEHATVVLQPLPRLQQIVLGKEARAVINGRLLAVGDEIAGYRLQAIKSHTVLLISRQGIQQLSLIEETLRDSAVPTDPPFVADQPPSREIKRIPR
jgi:hypothetical protein